MTRRKKTMVKTRGSWGVQNATVVPGHSTITYHPTSTVISQDNITILDPCVPDVWRGWIAVPRACPPTQKNVKSRGLFPEFLCNSDSAGQQNCCSVTLGHRMLTFFNGTAKLGWYNGLSPSTASCTNTTLICPLYIAKNQFLNS